MVPTIVGFGALSAGLALLARHLGESAVAVCVYGLVALAVVEVLALICWRRARVRL
jgi:hypothetical protein